MRYLRVNTFVSLQATSATLPRDPSLANVYHPGPCNDNPILYPNGMLSSTNAVLRAPVLLQREGMFYDYSDPGFSPETRHFTQNVWRSTTHVGFGFGSAVDQYGKFWVSYVVAKFYRPGNVEDQFVVNVLPPVSVSVGFLDSRAAVFRQHSAYVHSIRTN